MNTPSMVFGLNMSTNIETASSTGATIHEYGGYVVHEWTGSGHTGTFTPATTAKYEMLVIGAGGCGGGDNGTAYGGGGGGAGGVILAGYQLNSGSSYSIQVGTQTISTTDDADTDRRSFVGSYIAYPGGSGGDGGVTSGGKQADGRDGGSGGGRAINLSGGGSAGDAIYTSEDPKNFGSGGSSSGNGGAGGGSNGGPPDSNTGGTGITLSWLGTSVEYAKGGDSETNPSQAGNTPGSGGEGAAASSGAGGAGAAGIVLIRYRTSV